MAKRRVFVAFEEDLEDGAQAIKRQKKIVVSVDNTATNDVLAQEIAETLKRESDVFVLELPGGFELRPQDLVLDTIREDELVTSRVISASLSRSALSANPVKEKSSSHSYPSARRYTAQPNEPGRIQIRLVSAELARRHSSTTVKDGTAVTNGILAFDGEFISGNTSLNVLRREAARAFGWISEDATIIDDDNQCDHQRDTEAACSCGPALEIEQYGLFSTLHCRFVLDGEICPNQDCPYSHARLNFVNDTSTPPHCIICGEFLGFPCPKCMQYATDSCMQPSEVLHCSLVQNAGCGHLHHAHCFHMSKGASVGCPSGCLHDKFPREASVFDPFTPHIIVVWNGDKIDRIPVVAPHGDFIQSSPLELTSDEVISLVQGFLSGKGFTSPGLSLRIHSRDASTETVRFTQSTLVSICHASMHIHQTHHRFIIFPIQVVPPPFPLSAKRGFQVDLHTSCSPVIACGCTCLRDLFCTERGTQVDAPIVLYAVKRQINPSETAPKRGTVSKEKTYLFDQAWQPSIPQTTRGMAALLSCLYCLTCLISLKGVAAEVRVLSTLHQMTCFPPAVRTLGILLLNRDVRSEERAALSEAIYHALKNFLSCSSRGPAAIITDPNRFFEAARILFAHIIEKAKNVQFPIEHIPLRPLEEVPLVCATSRKLLKDPILMDSQIVNRVSAALHQLGGELYRPSSMPIIAEMKNEEAERLKRLLSHCGALTVADPSIQSIMVVDLDKLVPVPSSPGLAQIGRDLVGAIEDANKTSLVTRGPLDLKSANVIPPQIVLDQEGLLAVFTGRGCGTTRDVNFFRPMNGGDTEVDVNDVSYSLVKVIEQRRAEDTWQVDTFGGVSAAPIRPPDEAIVLCLDLSESMSKKSGVSGSKMGGESLEEDSFDPETASWELLEDLAKDVSDDVILETAENYLRKQHPSCHRAWKFYVDGRLENGSEMDDMDYAANNLLDELGVMARRDALNLSLSPGMKSKMLELAHFSTACDQQSAALAEYLTGLLAELSDSEDVGVEPYQVPRRLIDIRTGDLLLDPVVPENVPNDYTFVNADSREWFENQAIWPTGSFESGISHFFSVSEVQEAVTEWISGKDILHTMDAGSLLKDKQETSETSETCGDAIQVTLIYEGHSTVWNLSISTSTRTLYCLANRATKARHSRFTIRMMTSKATITDSAYITLGLTELSHGGVIEISFALPHRRRLTEVTIRQSDDDMQVVFLPQDAPILALIGYLDPVEFGAMSDMQLWHGLRPAGDGVRRGTEVKNEHNLNFYGFGTTREFELLNWSWMISGSLKEREKSRYLDRLDVLKELFNVFINRACSFDTSVSLVLGLVTFSDKAIVKQELTPIFESFKQQLDKVYAGGDTVVYDALDTARSMLVNYRSDLPKLRKRIIIVTDGADTNSKSSAYDVCHALQKSNIVVDSIQVGDRSDNTLHGISVATGGYRFCPKTSLSDALSIFDLETMLSLAERPPIPPKPPVLHNTTLTQYGNIMRFPVDVVTISQFPSRATHVKLQESVKPAAHLVSKGPINDDRTKRIMREVKALAADPHPQIDLYVNDSDISFLKIILEGPKDDNTKSPYRNGTFLLTCDIPQSYPRDPPEVRFVTFILHPNVSKQGKICVAELSRLWSSDITLKEIFSLIYGLLLEPDLENPVEIQASLKYYDDDGTFAFAVAEAVIEHASKSREQWKLELTAE